MTNQVILINPPSYQQIETYDHPDYPSITMGYLAGDLLKHNIPCQVIDAKLEGLTIDDTIKRLEKGDFQVVGITAMTHEIIQAACLAEEIKTKYPEKIIVIGGVHATALPQQTMEEFSAFDILVVGEGEEVFSDIVSALDNATPLSEIAGIAYRDNGEILLSPSRPRLQNLDELAYPAYELFPRAGTYHLITARGCPFQCIFCMSPYGRRLVRERSPQNIIEEIKLVEHNYHPERIKLNDEAFGFNLKRAHTILDLIIEQGLSATPKSASMRVNNVDQDILRKMKQAGFDYIDYGVESGNSEMLKRIKKGITLEQVEKAVKLTRQAGIRVGVNVIMGFPHETMETAKQTIDFAVKLNADLTAIGIMVPYPGTEVARMAAKGEGGYKIISQNWQDFNKQMGNALELDNLSRKDLEHLQLMGYIKIYAYNFRWIELLKMAWQYRRAAMKIFKKVLKN